MNHRMPLADCLEEYFSLGRMRSMLKERCGDALFFENVSDGRVRDYFCFRIFLKYGFYGFGVEMVRVLVGDKHDVDVGKGFKPRRPTPGVGEEPQPFFFYEEATVPEFCDVYGVIIHITDALLCMIHLGHANY